MMDRVLDQVQDQDVNQVLNQTQDQLLYYYPEFVFNYTVFLNEEFNSPEYLDNGSTGQECDMTLKARVLLKEFMTLAMLVNDYLYKPQETGWICLTGDLKTFQHNMNLWISDQETVDLLDTAIAAVIEAEFALSCNILDISAYGKFHDNMKHAKFLIDFLQFKWTEEPKMDGCPDNEVVGILYWP